MKRKSIGPLFLALTFIFLLQAQSSSASQEEQPYNWYIHEDCRAEMYTENSQVLTREGFATHEVVHYFYYNNNGELIKSEVDDGDDGTIDSTIHYYYNDEGQLIRIGDNQHLFYDEEGKQTKIETETESGDSTVYFYYDSAGKLSKREYIVDGSAGVATTNYYYDASGKLSRAEFVGSGGFTYVEYYHYDEDGKLVRVETEGDSTARRIITWQCGYQQEEDAEEPPGEQDHDESNGDAGDDTDADGSGGSGGGGGCFIKMVLDTEGV